MQADVFATILITIKNTSTLAPQRVFELFFKLVKKVRRNHNTSLDLGFNAEPFVKGMKESHSSCQKDNDLAWGFSS